MKRTSPTKACADGARYGRLVVIADAGRSKRGATMVKVRCDCGAVTIVRWANIVFGNTRSCGCGKCSGFRMRYQQSMPVTQIAEEAGVSRATIYARLRRNLPVSARHGAGPAEPG